MKNTFFYILIFVLNNANAQISDFKTIDFTQADNIAKSNNGDNLNNMPLLTYKLTNMLSTDIEKFRAIYTWVCNNITGDSNQHNKVSRKRKQLKNDSLGYIIWNNEYKKIAFKKLLKHKKTMCTGYAYLIKEFCFLANIECKIVDGYGRSVESNVNSLESVNHSWNAVKLNNKWYLCDATWSSGYMLNNYLFIKDYNDGYFLTEPTLFAKNHYPIQKKWFLNDSLSNSEFIATPIVYGETFNQKIIPISPKDLSTASQKNEAIHFSFKALKKISLDKISLVRFSGIKEHSFKIYELKNENGLITFKYLFKHKGIYDIHLKIENDIVATYIIEVQKS